jgi:hypothetical protein
MHPLHLTKLAYGCEGVEALQARWDARAAAGDLAISTRYRPTRHTELLGGGSLYWIIKHQLVARQVIERFEEVDGRCHIHLALPLIPVRPQPRRIHQGWRYMVGADAPRDLSEGGEDLGEMPLPLTRALAELGLI